jgi:hypothetical protein
MAVITLPSSEWARVSGVPSIKPKPRFTSPTALTSQAFVWDGESFAFSFELPPLSSASAIPWITALRKLEIADDTFTANMSNFMSSDVSGTSTMSLRVVQNSARFDVGKDGMYHISFQAEKAQ